MRFTEEYSKSPQAVQDQSPPTSEILGIPITLTEELQLVEEIKECLENNRRGWVCGINGLALNLANEHEWIRQFYKGALLNCSEGVGVSVAAFLTGRTKPTRIVWSRWVYRFLEMMEKQDYSLFLLGSTNNVLERAVLQLKKRFSRLRVVGSQHGYFDDCENKNVIDHINASGADVLFVAMGMPKQEEWIYRNFDGLKVKIVLPVGALLDYVSGRKKMCPRWMSAAGLEWVFRLFNDPARFWRRYLLGNPQLIWRCLKDLVGYRSRHV